MKIANKNALLELDLQVAISDACDVHWEDVVDVGRKRDHATARKIYAILVKELIPSRSLEDIGEALGGRNHSSVSTMLAEAQKHIDVADEIFCTPYYEVRRALGI